MALNPSRSLVVFAEEVEGKAPTSSDESRALGTPTNRQESGISLTRSAWLWGYLTFPS